MRLFEKILPQQIIDHRLNTKWLQAIQYAHTRCSHPCAIIHTRDTNEIVYSFQNTGKIENLENTLFLQNADGIIFYSATIQGYKQTQDVFVAQLVEQGHTCWIWYAPCNNISLWWIEPRNIQNLLNRRSSI